MDSWSHHLNVSDNLHTKPTEPHSYTFEGPPCRRGGGIGRPHPTSPEVTFPQNRLQLGHIQESTFVTNPSHVGEVGLIQGHVGCFHISRALAGHAGEVQAVPGAVVPKVQDPGARRATVGVVTKAEGSYGGRASFSISSSSRWVQASSKVRNHRCIFWMDTMWRN